MENTEIHYEMTVGNSRMTWNERLSGLVTQDGDYGPPATDKEAIDQANMAVNFFNSTLRPAEGPRILKCVQRIETKVIDLIPYKE